MSKRSCSHGEPAEDDDSTAFECGNAGSSTQPGNVRKNGKKYLRKKFSAFRLIFAI